MIGSVKGERVRSHSFFSFINGELQIIDAAPVADIAVNYSADNLFLHAQYDFSADGTHMIASNIEGVYYWTVGEPRAQAYRRGTYEQYFPGPGRGKPARNWIGGGPVTPGRGYIGPWHPRVRWIGPDEFLISNKVRYAQDEKGTIVLLDPEHAGRVEVFNVINESRRQLLPVVPPAHPPEGWPWNDDELFPHAFVEVGSVLVSISDTTLRTSPTIDSARVADRSDGLVVDWRGDLLESQDSLLLYPETPSNWGTFRTRPSDTLYNLLSGPPSSSEVGIHRRMRGDAELILQEVSSSHAEPSSNAEARAIEKQRGLAMTVFSLAAKESLVSASLAQTSLAVRFAVFTEEELRKHFAEIRSFFYDDANEIALVLGKLPSLSPPPFLWYHLAPDAPPLGRDNPLCFHSAARNDARYQLAIYALGVGQQTHLLDRLDLGGNLPVGVLGDLRDPARLYVIVERSGQPPAAIEIAIRRKAGHFLGESEDPQPAADR